MLKFFVRRLLSIIPLMLAITFIVFSIMSLTPGSPGRIILGVQAKQEDVDALNHELGYDRPFFVRFFNYVLDALRGDFGESYRTGNPVFRPIFARFPVTLRLAIACVTTSVIIGLPLGILSAVKQYSILDRLMTVVAFFFSAVPSFWLGLVLMLVFALQLHLLPSSGVSSWRHYILPVLTLSLPSAGGFMMLSRTTMLETIRMDYIRTARAKGAAERSVIWKHALRNALLPIVTTVGISFGYMMGGTVFAETVFAMPGVGSVIISAIRMKDVPQVLACVLFFSFLFLVIMVLVDILYAFIDPRIKARYLK
jgi:peptide/nickel transport system permease protein